MVLGKIVALVMVSKCVKFHKICFNRKEVMAKVKVLGYFFSKLGQRSNVKVKFQKVLHWWKGLLTRNAHVKYESPAIKTIQIADNIKFYFQSP